MEALSVVAEVARQTRDDVLLRMITQRQRKSATKRLVSSTPASVELRRVARSDREAELKRRADRRELERLVAHDDAAAKLALEEAKTVAAHARRETLEASRLFRQGEDDRRTAGARARGDARWLQTEYPLQLANTLLRWRVNLTPADEMALAAHVRAVTRTQRCLRTTEVPFLWDDDVSLTHTIGQLAGVNGERRAARCSKDFEWLLFRDAWAAESGDDAAVMMLRLLERVMPECRNMFTRRYTVPVMMSATGHTLEKTFVYAVILMSKWLGADRFPHGVHAWPPVR